MFTEERTYTRRILKIGGEEHYFISFKDSVGSVVEVEVDKGVYSAIREHDLIDARIAWSDRMHMERLDLSNDEIDSRARREHCTVEKEAQLSLCIDEVVNSIEDLPTRQRRRFLLHRIAGMTYKKIAALEGAPSSTIHYDVKQTEKKLKRIYKKFL